MAAAARPRSAAVLRARALRPAHAAAGWRAWADPQAAAPWVRSRSGVLSAPHPLHPVSGKSAWHASPRFRAVSGSQSSTPEVAMVSPASLPARLRTRAARRASRCRPEAILARPAWSRRAQLRLALLQVQRQSPLPAAAAVLAFRAAAVRAGAALAFPRAALPPRVRPAPAASGSAARLSAPPTAAAPARVRQAPAQLALLPVLMRPAAAPAEPRSASGRPD